MGEAPARGTRRDDALPWLRVERYPLVWLAEKEGVQDAVAETLSPRFIQGNAWPDEGGC